MNVDKEAEIHQVCIDKKYIKKDVCKVTGGKYEIKSLPEFIVFQEKLGTKFEKTDIDGKKHVILYRVDFDTLYDYDIFEVYPKYSNRLDLYKSSPDNILPVDAKKRPTNLPIISWNTPFADPDTDNNFKIFKWGHEPSIGINVGCDKSIIDNYIPTKAYMTGKCTVFEFYIPIRDNIMVCCIPQECEWTHITCDKFINETYHLIGHLEKNAEMNIIDKGRDYVAKVNVKLMDVNKNQIKSREYAKLVPISGGYYDKYMKYKNKYLSLKKLIK